MADLGDLTATLRANTAPFTAGMQDAVAQLRQLGIEAGKATGAERAMLVQQQQTLLAGLKKQGLVVINGQLVASETALAEATAKTTSAFGGQAVGIGRIERSMASLIARAFGIPEQFGSITASVARMTAGMVGSLGIVAAIGVVVYAFDALIQKLRETNKAAEESRKRLQAAFDATVFKQQLDDVNQAFQDLQDAKQKLAQLQAEPAGGLALGVRGAPRSTILRGQDTASNQAAMAAQQQVIIDKTNLYNQALKDLHQVQEERDTQNRKGIVSVDDLQLLDEAQKAVDAFARDWNQRRAELTARGLNPNDSTLLGMSDADFKKAIEGWDKFAGDVAKDQTEAFNNRADAVQKEQDELQRQQRRSLENTQRFLQQQGQRLADALTQGMTEGNMATRLTDALKRMFEDIIARLIESKIFKPLEDAILKALSGGDSSGGGGGGGLVGTLIGAGLAIATGGATIPTFGAPSALPGAATLARGAVRGVNVPVSALPPMPSPTVQARDAQWLAVFSETSRVASQQGIRLGVS